MNTEQRLTKEEENPCKTCESYRVNRMRTEEEIRERIKLFKEHEDALIILGTEHALKMAEITNFQRIILNWVLKEQE